MGYSQGYEQQGNGAGWLEKTKIRGHQHYGTTIYLLPYIAVRVVQVVALVVVLGFTANWITVFGHHHLHIPNILNLMLGFAAAGILPAIFAIFFAYAGQWMLLALFCLSDITFIVAFSYFAATLAPPLRYVTCSQVGNQTAAVQDQYASDFYAALDSNQSLTAQLHSWVVSSGTQCMELQGMWGLCIALPLLFFISLVLTPVLVYLKRNLQKGGKHDGDER